MKIWWGAAGEIVEATVDDASGAVTSAWTGPQVAWGMARGIKGALGGTKINTPLGLGPCSASCSSSAWPTSAGRSRFATSTS